MARARNIKPALFKNELLGVADPLLTLLFQSLWMLADKEGLLEDRPLRIKAETFPYREGLDINGYLTELQRLGFVKRYSVGSLALIQVVNFKKHQTPHSTEKPSELPHPSKETIENININTASVNPPLNNCENVVALPTDLLIPDLLIPDSTTLSGAPDVPKIETPNKTTRPFTAEAVEALEYLNEKSVSKFKPVESNVRLIVARMKEGATLAEIKQVIDAKVLKWIADPKMQDYLRPGTLFNAVKYAQYAGQLGPIDRGKGEWLEGLGKFESELTQQEKAQLFVARSATR